MNSFIQLSKLNFFAVYRNRTGLFFTIAMPAIILTVLSLLPIERIFSMGNFNYTQFVLPGIIAMSIFQSGLYGLSYWTIDMRRIGVFKRFAITPISKLQLLLTLLLTRSFVLVIQALLLCIIGILFFGVKVTAFTFLFLGIVFLVSFCFLLLGLTVSTLVKSYEEAAPITSVIGLPLTFLSSIFYPIDSLPVFLQKISYFLPTGHAANLIRYFFVDDILLKSLGVSVAVIAIWTLVLFLITYRKFKLN